MLIAEDTIDLSAVDTATPAETATRYVTETGDDGITVHPENDNNNKIQIDATGLDVIQSGESVAFYGQSARIGKAGSSRVEIEPSELKMVTEDGAVAMDVSASGQTMNVPVSESINQNVQSGGTYVIDFGAKGAVNGTTVTATFRNYELQFIYTFEFTVGTDGTDAFYGASAVFASNVLTITADLDILILGCGYTKSATAPRTDFNGFAYLNGKPLFTSDCIKVTAVESGNISVSSGSHNTGTFTGTVSEAGQTWRPVGVTGWRITNGSSGSGYHYATFNHLYLSAEADNSATISWRIRAVGGAVSNCHVIAYVIWIRTA